MRYQEIISKLPSEFRINIKKIPIKYRENAAHMLRRLSEGQHYSQLGGKKLTGQEGYFSIPLKGWYRLIGIERNGRCEPLEVFTHEEYNKKVKNISLTSPDLGFDEYESEPRPTKKENATPLTVADLEMLTGVSRAKINKAIEEHLIDFQEFDALEDLLRIKPDAHHKTRVVVYDTEKTWSWIDKQLNRVRVDPVEPEEKEETIDDLILEMQIALEDIEKSRNNIKQQANKIKNLAEKISNA